MLQKIITILTLSKSKIIIKFKIKTFLNIILNIIPVIIMCMMIVTYCLNTHQVTLTYVLKILNKEYMTITAYL